MRLLLCFESLKRQNSEQYYALPVTLLCRRLLSTGLCRQTCGTEGFVDRSDHTGAMLGIEQSIARFGFIAGDHGIAAKQFQVKRLLQDQLRARSCRNGLLQTMKALVIEEGFQIHCCLTCPLTALGVSSLSVITKAARATMPKTKHPANKAIA
jgi:hypothetical protein